MNTTIRITEEGPASYTAAEYRDGFSPDPYFGGNSWIWPTHLRAQYDIDEIYEINFAWTEGRDDAGRRTWSAVLDDDVLLSSVDGGSGGVRTGAPSDAPPYHKELEATVVFLCIVACAVIAALAGIFG